MKPVAPLVLGALALLALPVSQADARARLRERIAERMAQRAMQSNAPAAPAAMTLAYGKDPAQVLDYWAPVLPQTGGVKPKVPLVLFVHGGGWKRGSKDNAAGGWKQVHYPRAGYAYASINYRLVPEFTVEQQAADVAMAVKALLARADELGIDPTRVVLMGHSAGAHLVALVGTDEQYLKSAGLSFRNIAGVVPIDGAAFDVPAQMTDGPQIMQQTYAQAFGTDPARQRALSPTWQATAPNAPTFLVPHVQRADGVRQSAALAAALRKGGSSAETAGFPGEGLRGHGEINRSMGDPDYAATPVVDAWLKQVLGR